MNCPACKSPDHFDTMQAGTLVYVCAECSYSWAPKAPTLEDDNSTHPLQAFFAPIGAIEFE